MSLHAWSDYARASESAGVTVRNLRPHECVTAADILTELWGGSPMGAPLLVAMEHAGTLSREPSGPTSSSACARGSLGHLRHA